MTGLEDGISIHIGDMKAYYGSIFGHMFVLKGRR